MEKVIEYGNKPFLLRLINFFNFSSLFKPAEYIELKESIKLKVYDLHEEEN